MRVVVQRVSSARVSVEGATVGAIDAGLLLLVGFAHLDTPAVVAWMIDKVAGIRIFADAEGKMNLDLAAANGSVLVVSQFTLYGDASRGRRPSFVNAAQPAVAIPLYETFISGLRARGLNVATGDFGADMQVALVNDGPVTLLLERTDP